jgi:sulfur-carrier protein adenylyltransferase/sulfurtransferase
MTTLEVLTALKNNTALLLDIREEYEEPVLELPNLICISLYELIHHLDQLDKNKKIIIICQRGNRSEVAYQLLKDNGYDNIVDFKLGAILFFEEIKNNY